MKLFISYIAKEKNWSTTYGNTEVIADDELITMDFLRKLENTIKTQNEFISCSVLYYAKLEG